MDSLNRIVHNDNFIAWDKKAIFDDEEVVQILPDATMVDLLVRIGAFPSKGQARKNWKGSITIPDGFSEFFIGKKRRHLTIWNPSE